MFHFSASNESENQVNASTFNTSLKNAILGKNPEAVEVCLQNGANPNSQFSTMQITPLLLAVSVSSLETIQILLDNGADVTMADIRGTTPLHLAAEIGMTNLVSCLIAAGADVNAQDITNETPLHRAAAGDHLEVLEHLVSSGAQVYMLNAFEIP